MALNAEWDGKIVNNLLWITSSVDVCSVFGVVWCEAKCWKHIFIKHKILLFD